MSTTEWSYRVKFQPAEARRRILAAFKAAKGNATDAALHLELPRRSLTRYIADLELTEEVEALRREYDFPDRRGRWPVKES